MPATGCKQGCQMLLVPVGAAFVAVGARWLDVDISAPTDAADLHAQQ